MVVSASSMVWMVNLSQAQTRTNHYSVGSQPITNLFCIPNVIFMWGYRVIHAQVRKNKMTSTAVGQKTNFTNGKAMIQ